MFAWNSENVNRSVCGAVHDHVLDDKVEEELEPVRTESLNWESRAQCTSYLLRGRGRSTIATRRKRCGVRGRGSPRSASSFVIFVFEFLFDFIIENVVIRTTHAYAFAKTYEPLTLWAGEVYQFPIYESILVALVGCVFTWARMEAEERPAGQSPIEVGAERWRPSLQPWRA